ncbi:hypothetical protein B0H67DRAFT_270466 [Lasiosphaeris hirsuta]|uniref:Uncharacterized protein n=1 Tax=Lasiosphaeris hirsuta TaxID=260670 RepID=A0AA40A895_9PEZI|nr:hypothetical protein B0H67DRAFT_270466 [Lasiosphaeris hirsuta]
MGYSRTNPTVIAHTVSAHTVSYPIVPTSQTRTIACATDGSRWSVGSIGGRVVIQALQESDSSINASFRCHTQPSSDVSGKSNIFAVNAVCFLPPNKDVLATGGSDGSLPSQLESRKSLESHVLSVIRTICHVVSTYFSLLYTSTSTSEAKQQEDENMTLLNYTFPRVSNNATQQHFKAHDAWENSFATNMSQTRLCPSLALPVSVAIPFSRPRSKENGKKSCKRTRKKTIPRNLT